MQGQRWSPKPGVHTIEITAEPVYAERTFGNRTNEGVDIPTDHGVLSTGNKALLAALAEADERLGGIVGATVRFKVYYDGSPKDPKNRRIDVIGIK